LGTGWNVLLRDPLSRLVQKKVLKNKPDLFKQVSRLIPLNKRKKKYSRNGPKNFKNIFFA
jgi:hypothetical protein